MSGSKILAIEKGDFHVQFQYQIKFTFIKLIKSFPDTSGISTESDMCYKQLMLQSIFEKGT